MADTATMDTNVQTQNTSISFSDIENMSIEERNKNLDSGKFDHLAYSKDIETKKNFEKVFTAKPKEPSYKPAPVEKQPETKKEENKETVKPEEKPVPVEEKKPAETTTDDWKGYGSKEAMLDAFEEMRKLTAKRKKEIDQRNAESGKLGRETKELRERLEREGKEKEELRKKTEELKAKIQQPTFTVPNISDEVKAALGEEYVNGRINTDKHLIETSNLTTKQLSELQEGYRNLAKWKEERVSKEAQEEAERKERRAQEDRESYQKSLQKLYEDADDLQKDASELKMNRKFGDLNEEILAHTDPSTGACDPDFIKTIAPTDLKSFNKIKDLIMNGYGEFTPEGFKKNAVFKNLRQRYLLHLDETGELQKIQAERALAAERKAANEIKDKITKREDTAITIPDIKSSGSDASGIVSHADKKNRISEIMDKYAKGTITDAEDKELDKLLNEVGQGGAVPNPKNIRS